MVVGPENRKIQTLGVLDIVEHPPYRHRRADGCQQGEVHAELHEIPPEQQRAPR